MHINCFSAYMVRTTCYVHALNFNIERSSVNLFGDIKLRVSTDMFSLNSVAFTSGQHVTHRLK